MNRRFLIHMNRLAAFLALFLVVAAGGTVTVFAQNESRPELEISLRNPANVQVEQGEPVQLDIRLRMNDGAEPASIVLAPVSGTWVEAIDVFFIDTEGQPTGVRAQPVARPEDAATTLTPSRIAGGLWRFAPGTTQELRPGVNKLRARLAINAAVPGSDGWTGEIFSQDISLEIISPSSDSGHSPRRAISLAEDAILGDRLEEAANVLDALLSEQPNNLRAWTLRAVVCERAGNILGALQSVNEAHRIYEALGTDEPYVELRSMNRSLIAALAAPDAGAKITAPLPGWSWPRKDLLPATISSGPLPRATDPEPMIPENEPPAIPSSHVDSVMVVPVAETREADYLTDPRGQWATSASASSEYDKDRYNSAQAVGAPDVESYSDNPNAWCHSGEFRQEEWLEVRFADPVIATELRVRQNYTPGTLAKVEAFAADGRSQTIWEGTDPNHYPDGQISWFVLRFPATGFPVQGVKFTLNIARVPGWKQIDAVQLVGDAL